MDIRHQPDFRTREKRIDARIAPATMVLLICCCVLSCQANRPGTSGTAPAISAPASGLSRSELVFGTLCSVKLGEGSNPALLDKAFSRLRQLDADLSVDREGSQVDAVNAGSGIKPIVVGKDALAILERDLTYAALTSGGFDPSIGPLVKLWAISSEHPHFPTPAELSNARNLVGYKDIVLDSSAGSIFLRRTGMSLDLGSGTKGYAADEIATLLRQGGVRSALIDLGGNVYVLGAKPDGSDWHIGLQDPAATRGDFIGIASLKDATMVTSGVYERFFMHEGKRYHHILDPFTGYPYENGLTSVTIIAPRSFDADGMTTALFALGREKGMAYAEQHGILAIMVDDTNHVWLSPGVSAIFRLTSAKYSLAEPAAPAKP